MSHIGSPGPTFPSSNQYFTVRKPFDKHPLISICTNPCKATTTIYDEHRQKETSSQLQFHAIVLYVKSIIIKDIYKEKITSPSRNERP